MQAVNKTASCALRCMARNSTSSAKGCDSCLLIVMAGHGTLTNRCTSGRLPGRHFHVSDCTACHPSPFDL